MRKAQVLTLAMIALAIAGCERKERNRANDMGNMSSGSSQSGTPTPSPGTSSGPAVATGPGGLRIDTSVMLRDCINPADVNRPLSDFSAEQKRALVICANRVGARQASTQMPLRIDPVTTITSIVAQDTTVIYNVRIEMDAANLPPNAAAQLEAGARANACSRADMRQTMSMGGSYAYVWTDRNGQPILQLRIDGC